MPLPLSNARRPGKAIAFADPLGIGLEAQGAACLAAGFAPIFAVEDGARRTFDLSEYVALGAAAFSPEALAAGLAALIEDGVFTDAAWIAEYLAALEASELRFTEEALARTVVKYGWAVAFAAELAEGFAGEIGVTFADAALPATPLEHFFVARELRRRGVDVATLALRLPGTFEAAGDFEGDIGELEAALAAHVAVARFTGAHRIGVPHGEWKFPALPVIGRVCGELLHIEMSGLSWVESLRVAARLEPALFREMLVCAQEHFVFDRSGRAITTSEEDVRFLPDVSDAELERTFLEDPRGRQLLHVTARSILAEPALAERLHPLLPANAGLHGELLAGCVGHHLAALTGGLSSSASSSSSSS